MSTSRALWAAVALATATDCRTTNSQAELALTPLERGHALIQKGDAAHAVPLFEQLAAEHPTDLNVLRGLAEAHVKAGSGQRLLDRTATTETPQAHYLRGLVLFARAAEAGTAAIAEFRKAVELGPNEPEFVYRLGVALLESENDAEAKAALEKAIASAPTKASWRLPLAKAQFRTGDTAAAVASIREVVEHSPSLAEAKTAKALMDQIADPFANFPKAARGTLERGLQWLQVADVPQQAILQFEEILHDYPDLAVVHALLGLAYSRIDDSGRAVDELRRAVELAPNDGKNQLYLGEFYLARQRAPQAKEHFERAIAFNPTLAPAWAHLGDLALERQELDGAQQAFAIVSRLEPEDINARGKLALAYQLQGNWAAADRELKTVVEQQPENLEFMLRLGVLHTERFTKAKSATEKKDAAAEATTWLEKVLDAQPENALASRALERVKRP